MKLISIASLAAMLAFGQMAEKAKYLQRNLIDKHLLEGLYVSIVPAAPEGTKLPHTVDDPGNVIHAGVWTGRYLAGVAYQYAVPPDEAVRKHGGDILTGLRRLQEVTGKPGLLARDLWDLNWMEGNPLYTFMTVALIPNNLPHAEESIKLSIDTLRRYPIIRVMHPVMNRDVEMSPFEDRGHARQAAKPVPSISVPSTTNTRGKEIPTRSTAG